MNKNFDDFLATLDEETFKEILSKHKNSENTISSNLENSVLVNLELLELYHNWLTSKD
ncbi:hypothetical protein ACI1TW_03230 [Lactococcus garvieae]|uniref:hypothetical protein n=1 Tax=Lactococcus garvieae TaxID=1363 RepID=UPI003854E46D